MAALDSGKPRACPRERARRSDRNERGAAQVTARACRAVDGRTRQVYKKRTGASTCRPTAVRRQAGSSNRKE
jgi:hypothetical protein